MTTVVLYVEKDGRATVERRASDDKFHTPILHTFHTRTVVHAHSTHKVTYRQTSRDLDCDAPTAKQILETVAKESADQASTCWCVSGWTADGVYAFRLVAGNEVEGTDEKLLVSLSRI